MELTISKKKETVQYYWTREEQLLQKWDKFVQNSPQGHYLLLSDWIKSYCVYGFDYEVLLIMKDEKIIGGAGMVIVKFALFKLNIIPYGPILNEDNDLLYNETIKALLDHSKYKGACYTQMNVPAMKKAYLDHDFRAIFPNVKIKNVSIKGNKGNKFNRVLSISRFGFVNLYQGESDPYHLVRKNYNSRTKRAIKRSKTYNAEIRWADKENLIERVYAVIIDNAKERNYSVRSWEAFKPTLLSLLEKGYCKVPYCLLDGEIVGGLILFNAGRRLAYVMGGTKKAIKGFNVGYFLQDEVIKHAIHLSHTVYEIGMSGSAGVKEFKRGFGTVMLQTEGVKHWVHNKFMYSIFEFGFNQVRDHKKLIEKILLTILRYSFKRQ